MRSIIITIHWIVSNIKWLVNQSGMTYFMHDSDEADLLEREVTKEEAVDYWIGYLIDKFNFDEPRRNEVIEAKLRELKTGN